MIWEKKKNRGDKGLKKAAADNADALLALSAQIEDLSNMVLELQAAAATETTKEDDKK